MKDLQQCCVSCETVFSKHAKNPTQSKFCGKRFPGSAVVRNTHCALNVWWERWGRDPRSDELLISHNALSQCNKLHARHAEDETQLLLPVRASSLGSPVPRGWLWHLISHLLSVSLVASERGKINSSEKFRHFSHEICHIISSFLFWVFSSTNIDSPEQIQLFWLTTSSGRHSVHQQLHN